MKFSKIILKLGLQFEIIYSTVLGFLSQFVSHPVAQPDNAEYLLQKSGVTVEACMAGNRKPT